MRRHGPGRGTRHPRGSFSGTTVLTIPSGTTIDKDGIQTNKITVDGSQYPVTYSADGYKVYGGSVAWSGATLAIYHGLTTLTAFIPTLMKTGSAVSNPFAFIMHENGVGGVSVAFYQALSPNAIIGTGGTLQWMAFGA